MAKPTKKPIREQDALEYHRRNGKPGKFEIQPTKPVSTIRDLSLAYSPGVAYPCLAIAANPEEVYQYTAKGNTVAVISNGTAVLGLGNIGAAASKPVMEGKAILFKKYADIDGIDIEVDSEDVETIIQVVKALEPTFGGVNLEDIKAPECFEIERRLKEEMNIPVMHDDQHGTAIISGAALLSACELTGRKMSELRLVMSGAGAAAQACARLYLELGLRKENLVMVDIGGPLTTARTDLDEGRLFFASSRAELRTLADCFPGADAFVGLSAGGIVKGDMLKQMNAKPIVFALANPDPEITWEDAHAARPDVMMATGRSDYPNQVNNVLGFPYIFRGALDVHASKINEAMKMAAVRAISELAKEPVPEEICQMYGVKLAFGPDYLIPKPMDTRLITRVSGAVARAAMESGVARQPITDWKAYEARLEERMGFSKGLTRFITQKAQTDPRTVVFPEAEEFKILRAAQICVDEGIAQPILLGNRERILARLKEFEIDLEDPRIVDMKADADRRERYAQQFWEQRKRKGLTLDRARRLMTNPNYFGLMMVQNGEAESLLTGLASNYAECLVPTFETIGLESHVRTAAALYIMNTKRGTLFFADCTINKNPTAEELADIGALTARAVRFFNAQPRVAMLSYSNFGSARDEQGRKMSRAAQLLRQQMPDLIVEGDIQANISLRPDLQQEFYPFSTLADKGANTFIFPDLSSANIAYKLVQEVGEVEAIGPVLLGIEKPVHILSMGASVREIVNMAAMAVVDAQSGNEFF
ncbi:MAG: NADP-dependent malic enzyme [Bacteroidetes bacterium]|nr:NADP-dependent malic enzyme [Bacteroidota bacterium]